MATLMIGYAESGLTTAKFIRHRLSDGAFWSTAGTPAFEAYNPLHIANYGIAATEISSTGEYTATDPADTVPGDYILVKAAAATLVESDLLNTRWQSPAGPVISDFSTLQAHGDSNWRTATGFAVPGDAMTLTTGERSAVAVAWGTSIIGNGRTRDYFLQGGCNKISFAADGLSFTVYATDDVTPLYTGVSTRLVSSIGALRSVDPT